MTVSWGALWYGCFASRRADDRCQEVAEYGLVRVAQGKEAPSGTSAEMTGGVRKD